MSEGRTEDPYLCAPAAGVDEELGRTHHTPVVPCACHTAAEDQHRVCRPAAAERRVLAREGGKRGQAVPLCLAAVADGLLPVTTHLCWCC
jgi:hypothetical protein